MGARWHVIIIFLHASDAIKQSEKHRRLPQIKQKEAGFKRESASFFRCTDPDLLVHRGRKQCSYMNKCVLDMELCYHKISIAVLENS